MLPSMCLRLSQLYFIPYMGLCFKHTHFSCNDRENIYAHSSHGDNQFVCMNHQPLFGVRSWNSCIGCMSCYILIPIYVTYLHNTPPTYTFRMSGFFSHQYRVQFKFVSKNSYFQWIARSKISRNMKAGRYRFKVAMLSTRPSYFRMTRDKLKLKLNLSCVNSISVYKRGSTDFILCISRFL